MPPRPSFWDIVPWQYLGVPVALGLAYIASIVIVRVLARARGRAGERANSPWDDPLPLLQRGPRRLLTTIMVGWMLIMTLNPPGLLAVVVDKALTITLIGGLAWSATRALRVVAARIVLGAKRAELDEPALDGLRTQVFVLRRIASIAVGVIAFSVMLLQFGATWTVGASLLAVAAVAGIVLGLAAQRSIATLSAGLQLSITQPFRVHDTVIIDDEWGTIEEINLTYTVVKTWDERRLVVPMSRFLEQPFQSWTKVSPELLGTVYLYADYGLPVNALRAELARILEGNPRWDGRVKGVVVTDATERTIQIRALVSAASPSAQWGLRCEVREKLITFLREYEGGRYLPRTRIDPGAGLDLSDSQAHATPEPS